MQRGRRVSSPIVENVFLPHGTKERLRGGEVCDLPLSLSLALCPLLHPPRKMMAGEAVGTTGLSSKANDVFCALCQVYVKEFYNH